MNLIPTRVDIEVLVVGAGPAGSMAAKALSEEGREVLLVEKQVEVGRVVSCAEGISHESLRRFVDPDQNRWLAARLKWARVYSPSGEHFEVKKENMGYILERRIFDRHLVELALKSGADLLTSTTFLEARRERDHIVAKLQRAGATFEARAKMIVGADGVGSSVGRSLGLKVKFPIEDAHYCAQYLIVHPDIEEDGVHFFTGEDIAPGGYGWIFPKGKGIANVGVGIVRFKERAKEFLDNLVATYLPGAKILGYLRGVVPTGGHNLQIVADNVMLVGDAARLAEPLSGGGIPSAMASGYLAGHIGGEALKRGKTTREVLDLYPRTYWKENGRDFDLSYRVRNLFKNFTDRELDLILKELKIIFHRQNLEDIDPFYILGKALRSSRLMAFLLRVGKDALGKNLRELVFEHN